MTVRAKALYGQMPSVFALLGEILFTSQLEDEKRLKEILSRLKSRLQASLVSAGHSAAAMRAMSYTSGLAAYTDSTSGIAYYELVEDLEQHFEEKKAELMAELKGTDDPPVPAGEPAGALHGPALRTGSAFEGAETGLCSTGPAPGSCSVWRGSAGARRQKNEGFLTASEVQYVALRRQFPGCRVCLHRAPCGFSNGDVKLRLPVEQHPGKGRRLRLYERIFQDREIPILPLTGIRQLREYPGDLSWVRRRTLHSLQADEPDHDENTSSVPSVRWMRR